MKRIFSDLDGTLIDSRQRLYSLFTSIVPEAVSLSFDEYWKIKLMGLKHDQILAGKFNYTKAAVEHFEAQWMEKIENPVWLKIDKLFHFTIPSLRKLKSAGFQIIIVTTRRNKTTAQEQLRDLGLIEETDCIIISEKRMNKVQAVCHFFDNFSSDDIFVGDTEEDINAARDLAISAAGVCSGFRSREQLASLHPEHLCLDFGNFTEMLLSSQGIAAQ